MLFVLAFGITPKRALHNLIATHRDGQAKPGKKQDSVPSLNRATFNCQCDNLVIASPFLPGLPVVLSAPGTVVVPKNGCETVAPAFVKAIPYGLRGPPAA